MASDLTSMQSYYAQDKERDRLARDVGRVEYERTIEVICRTLPAPPAVVADIGGGPGRYTDWLARSGYSVVHRDVVAHHVEQVKSRHGDAVDARIGDARKLDVMDSSVDAVLLLGPLYHLLERDERVQAIREARRVSRPGGAVYIAAISRWSARLHGMLVSRIHHVFPKLASVVGEMEATGEMNPIVESGFTGYAHRPDELEAEIADGGLALESMVALEGISFALSDLDARMDDDAERALLMETLRAVEAVPELLGIGPHLLATARSTT